MRNVIVTKENAFLGMKVVRGRDWKYMEQDKDSVYGVITKITPEDWVYVDWIDEEGNINNNNCYEIGYNNIYSLYEYDSKLNNKNQISEIMENRLLTVEEISNLKKGDKIIILKRPDKWGGQGKYPLDLHYTYELEVVDIHKSAISDFHHIYDTKGYSHSIFGSYEAGVQKLSNSKNNKIMQTLSVTKTETVQIGKKKREITITVLVDNGRVRAGYSVRNPEDKKTNPELAKQISTGRALSDKTNLVDMTIGVGMDRKYILYAIAEQLFREIGSGKIQIKGIK